MEFLTGFAWSVPTAFSGAVGACRFEQGDVLYSEACAYDAYDASTEGSGSAAHWVQVLDPPKSARALTAEGEGNRFVSSWASPVELDLARTQDQQAERMNTTQGRLFTCLWRGDLGVLAPGDEEPAIPLLARELHGRLSEGVECFRSRFSQGSKGGGSEGRRILLMVLDQSSDASRIKVRAVESALAEAFPVESLDLTPVDAGLNEGEAFHPALVLRGLAIAEADAEQVEARAKAVLYSASEGKADRFSLSRHGHLAD